MIRRVAAGTSRRTAQARGPCGPEAPVDPMTDPDGALPGAKTRFVTCGLVHRIWLSQLAARKTLVARAICEFFV